MTMDKKPARTRKLSRKQIDEGLAEVPIASIIMGATAPGRRALTAKQIRFAEAIARGESKAGAYRAAYDTKLSKPKHQSLAGQKLAKHPVIAQQITALRLAAEAKRYATPAALRQLVIERLTAHAIDEDIPPAQRLQALKLLGQITEVAAFTERREIIKASDPGQARLALLESLRSALRANSVDVDALSPRASLLAELAPGDPPQPTDDPDPSDRTAEPLNHPSSEAVLCRASPAADPEPAADASPDPGPVNDAAQPDPTPELPPERDACPGPREA